MSLKDGKSRVGVAEDPPNLRADWRRVVSRDGNTAFEIRPEVGLQSVDLRSGAVTVLQPMQPDPEKAAIEFFIRAVECLGSQ